MPKNILQKLNLNKPKLFGIIAFVLTLLISLILFWDNKDVMYFLMGIGFVIGGMPFFISLIIEGKMAKEKNEMFLEFSRNLVESVKAGTPISKSILNIRNKDYGVLNPHIEKLANQISLGIPVQTALQTFARDLKNKTIMRAITIMSESEKAGGKIEEILDSVVKSVSQMEILRKERKAAMYTLIVQGYIIFMVFILIMLVMQFKVLPIASQLSKGDNSENGGMPLDLGGFGGGGGGCEIATIEELTSPFLFLLIVQGFFTGIVIGKLSEGSIKAGLKHSFILVVMAILISTGSKVLLG